MTTEREFDVVVFGATGFTGALVAEFLAETYGDTVKWAMAGRSREKLETAAERLGGGIPLVVADSADPVSLTAMAKRTKTVLTTVGPYQLYGTPLVRACVDAGTDYADLCGEPAWMHDVIAEFDDPAKASGARIALSCGFDSIPFDLGVYYLQKHAIEQTGAPLPSIKGRVRNMKGTSSGGTVASFRQTMVRAQREPEIVRWLKDPFSLVPGFEGPKQPSGSRPTYDDELGSWSAPFIMATINTKNVHRSNALLGHLYGRDFVYDEMVLTGPGEKGEALARRIAGDRSMAESNAQPGDGPSREERDAGFYDLIFTGTANNGTRLTAAVKGDKDPGYGSTSRMISEAALCLAFDIDKTVLAGGVVTPAAAMGDTLVGRLTAKAGLTFEMENAD